MGPVPTALFAFTPLYGTAPLPITFTNRSSGATNYLWNFGDGSSTTTAIPQINPDPHTYQQNGNYTVELFAYNNYGCYDSLARVLNIIPTDLDIAVVSIRALPQVQADGSELVTVIATLSNLGTRIITSAQLYATFGSKAVLEQNWSGYLASGQTITDTFPAQFVAPAGYTNSFVCVTASDVNDGETETNYNNNQECASLTGTMQLAGPLPNPAITTCLLGIILPQPGTVYVSIYDLLGNVIIPEFSMSLPAERTNYNIPIGQMQGSEYFIRVRYNDDTEVRNFVVR
jgi:PKD repeat protein